MASSHVSKFSRDPGSPYRSLLGSSSALDGKIVSESAMLQLVLASISDSMARNRRDRLHASLMVSVSFVLVVLCCVPACQVISSPIYEGLVPEDFVTKGTLSILVQDIDTPHGRLFTVGICTASLILLISNFPSLLYPSWSPRKDASLTDDIQTRSFREQLVRGMWLILPQIGFLLVGAVPTVSEPLGLEIHFFVLHAVCAQLGMITWVIFETHQLICGERALARLRGRGGAEEEPLKISQYIRIAALSLLWINCIVFSGIKVYNEVSNRLFGQPNDNMSLALVSFWCEVACIVLAYFLPMAAGWDFLIFCDESNDASKSGAALAEAFAARLVDSLGQNGCHAEPPSPTNGGTAAAAHRRSNRRSV
jgi:hypothetical protein